MKFSEQKMQQLRAKMAYRWANRRTVAQGVLEQLARAEGEEVDVVTLYMNAARRPKQNVSKTEASMLIGRRINDARKVAREAGFDIALGARQGYRRLIELR